MNLDFSNLHVHSDTSVLDGLARPEEIAERARKLGQPAVALTDHGTFGAVPDLYRACKKEGIGFIAGQEFYIVPDTQARGFGPQGNLKDGRNFHLTLLAKNEQGYRDLVKLSHAAHDRENFYDNPRIDHAMLSEANTENMICLSGCVGGELAQSFLEIIKPMAAKQTRKVNTRTKKVYDYWEWRHPRRNEPDHPLIDQALDAARDVLKFYRDLFPDGQYGYEIMYHGLAQEAWVIKYLLPEAKRYGLDHFITNDAHHTKPSEKVIYDIVWAIQTRSEFCGSNDPKILDLCSGNKLYERLEDIVPKKYLKSGIENTLKIADMASGFKITPLESKTHNIPKARDEFGEIITKPIAYIKKVSAPKLKRLCERYPDRADEYISRFNRELRTIKEFNYQHYFAATSVFVLWAKKQGIAVGVGRGSGAGSLVAHCTGITDIDPIRWRLRFERFLNPAKQSLPDFDIDFQSDRFEEVIEFLGKIYGPENVSRVSTYSRFAPRGLMTSLLETLPSKLDFQEIKEITKELPEDISDDEAELPFMDIWWKDVKASPSAHKLKAAVRDLKDNEGLDLVHYSKRLYGLRKGIGKHAAGVVISDDRLKLSDWVPQQLIASSGGYVTQYNMDSLDLLGFVKFDILSLATLTLCADVYEMIGGDPFPEFNDYDDEETYKLISAIETDAIFQLTGYAARQVVRQINGCWEFEDIVATMALGRPGVIRWVSKYRENKGKKKLKLAHPMLNELLKPSHGIILYQEDVLNIGYEIGMSDAEVDELLGAIKKMNHDKMRAVQPKFVKAARKDGWREEQIEQVWDQIKDYQGYGFNRSHAVSYADLAYKTAYLKANHPAEFIAGKLRRISKAKREERAPLVRYARSRGIEVKGPHFNYSGVHAEVQDGAIRFGLADVLHSGEPAAAAIIKRREARRFRPSDFVPNPVGPRGGKRDPYIKGIQDGEENKLKLNADARKALFAVGAFPGKKDKANRWANERELLGCNISEHHNQEALQSIKRTVLADTNRKALAKKKPNNLKVKYGGVITRVSPRVHKSGKRKGEPMAFVTVECGPREIELVMFAEIYGEYKKYVKRGSLVYGKANATYNDQYGKSIIVNTLQHFG